VGHLPSFRHVRTYAVEQLGSVDIGIGRDLDHDGAPVVWLGGTALMHAVRLAIGNGDTPVVTVPSWAVLADTKAGADVYDHDAAASLPWSPGELQEAYGR
jgi:hypothetical protein